MKKSQHTKQYKLILEELKKSRESADLTQTEVARHLGKHAPFVSKIETGERRIDIVELATLCELYGIKLTTFLKKVHLD